MTQSEFNLSGGGQTQCARILDHLERHAGQWVAMPVLALFYTGSLVTEPAREALLATYASSDARAGYTGTSRLGLALGGATGYLGGGWLLDLSRSMGLPALPWLMLAAIGVITFCALQRQLLPSRAVRLARQPC